MDYIIESRYLHLRPMIWLYKTKRENAYIKAVLHTGGKDIPLDDISFIKMLFLLGDRTLGRHDTQAHITLDGKLTPQEEKELEFIKENMSLDSELLDSEEYLGYKKFDFDNILDNLTYEDVKKYGFDDIKDKIIKLS